MTTTEERLAVLETKMTTLEEDVRDMRVKVDEMHNVLMQAKGARFAIVAVAGLAGFLAGVGAKLLPMLGR